MAEAQRLIPISADWILKRIQEGKKVRLKNAQINGDLDLGKLDLPTQKVARTDYQINTLRLPTECKIVSSPISISNTELKGDVNFSNCIFSGYARFDGATFSGYAQFDGATFREDAQFDGATFSRYARFDGATFRKDAGFEGASFNGRVKSYGSFNKRHGFESTGFRDATFSGFTRFKRTSFSHYAGFEGASFNDARFKEASFFDAGFEGASFRGYAEFEGVPFRGYAGFKGASFSMGADFEGASFNMDAEFEEASFSMGADFKGASFRGYAGFKGATFRKDAEFEGASFSMDAKFKGASFSMDAKFKEASFSGYAGFERTSFSGRAKFEGAKFEGDILTFRDATFSHAQIQENACRRAKNVQAKAGNRDEEEYHFYREMEAKRIQKGIRGDSGLSLGECLRSDTYSFWKLFFHDVLEFIFVQKIFGYGVHPFRLFGWWLAFVVIFAIIYSIKGAIEQPDARQWYDYLWFSIATAATPGYALYKPLGLFKIIAGIEAILGTFMWAAFITTFARKFSR